jgi:hypothetical protein
MIKKVLPIAALAIFATGCATTEEMPEVTNVEWVIDKTEVHSGKLFVFWYDAYQRRTFIWVRPEEDTIFYKAGKKVDQFVKL